MSDLLNLYSEDEECVKLDKDYLRAYKKVFDALPQKKKALIFDFDTATKKVTARKIYLIIENIQQSQSTKQKLKEWWGKWIGL